MSPVQLLYNKAEIILFSKGGGFGQYHIDDRDMFSFTGMIDCSNHCQLPIGKSLLYAHDKGYFALKDR